MIPQDRHSVYALCSACIKAGKYQRLTAVPCATDPFLLRVKVTNAAGEVAYTRPLVVQPDCEHSGVPICLDENLSVSGA
jgi:hypothetical protein